MGRLRKIYGTRSRLKRFTATLTTSVKLGDFTRPGKGCGSCLPIIPFDIPYLIVVPLQE
jgi:hypothetical protein